MNAPEFQLLVACCRCSYATGGEEEVLRGSTHIDWLTFLHLLRRHRVQGLAAQAFYRLRVSPPDSIAAEIAKDVAAIAEANLRSAAASIRLKERFGGAAIPLLFVKGLSVSALAYGDPFVKMSADIDILVDAVDTDSSAELLRDLGYLAAVPADRPTLEISRWHRRHKESIWTKLGGAAVELHTALSDQPALIPGIGTASPRQMVEIGRGRRLPTLNSADLFAYLCVHGASSAWFRLKWIVDVAALIHAMGGDIQGHYRAANARGAGRAPAQALLLADRLSLLRLPDALRSEIGADGAARRLVEVALAQLLNPREPTQRRFGTASIHWSQMLLLPGWRFKFSEAARQAIDIFDRR